MEIQKWMELVSKFIEALAIVLMTGFILVFTFKWLLLGREIESGFERYRAAVGKALLLGLEILIAADIIHTVAIDLTLKNLATLFALVVVRTILGWTLTLDVDGRWPWQRSKQQLNEQGNVSK